MTKPTQEQVDAANEYVREAGELSVFFVEDVEEGYVRGAIDWQELTEQKIAKFLRARVKIDGDILTGPMATFARDLADVIEGRRYLETK